MAEEKFKVVTTDGGTVNKGSSKTDTFPGLSREVADADCKQRNQKAEELGIKTRYEVVEHIA